MFDPTVISIFFVISVIGLLLVVIGFILGISAALNYYHHPISARISPNRTPLDIFELIRIRLKIPQQIYRKVLSHRLK